MAHITAKNAYKSLEERINKFPQGAPPSKTLYQILSILFTEEEARLVAKLPIKAFRLKTAANIWNVSQSEAYKILDNLAKKALILDLEDNKGKKYILPPPMAGFFEFSMMRTRQDTLRVDFIHRVEFGEVSGHRVLIKRGPGNRGPTECGTTHEATSGMSS